MKINLNKLYININQNNIWVMIKLSDTSDVSDLGSRFYDITPEKYLIAEGELGQLQTNSKFTVLEYFRSPIPSLAPAKESGYQQIFNEAQYNTGWVSKLTSEDLATIHPTLEKDLEKLVFWAKMKH